MDITNIIKQCLEENPCEADIRCGEPMKDHTTFKVGGPADYWISPDGEGFSGLCVSLLNHCRDEKIPLFILGGGANIVVSDKGIRGIVLDMNKWRGESVWKLCAGEDELILKSGTEIDEAADSACADGLSGLEFLAGMPGTIGGALWMNARCYEKEVSDVLSWAEVICSEECTGVRSEEGGVRSDELKRDYVIKRFEFKDKKGFGYKKSPFQDMDCLILSAAFKLEKGDKEKMLLDMENKRQDRQDKGHYLFPCAGSVFKNNRDFGKPAGQIIDELGLKGLKKGGAQVAPFHGNIIINNANATASDIRALVNEVKERVKKQAGFNLEPEILFVGEW